jgi:hypothetical protein
MHIEVDIQLMHCEQSSKLGITGFIVGLIYVIRHNLLRYLFLPQ